jgi:hypothetical protein
MKSRSEIWLSVLEDLGDMCSVSTHDDAAYARRRVAAEGDGFFTITLPKFAKDLEMALSDSVLDSELFEGYARRRITLPVQLAVGTPAWNVKSKKMPWGLPLFLGGFLSKLFLEPHEWMPSGVDSEEPFFPLMTTQPPCLLRDPSSEEHADEMAAAIFAIRQLSALFSKEKAPAPAKAERAAIESYVQVDKELDIPLWLCQAAPPSSEAGCLAMSRGLSCSCSGTFSQRWTARFTKRN